MSTVLPSRRVGRVDFRIRPLEEEDLPRVMEIELASFSRFSDIQNEEPNDLRSLETTCFT